MKKFFVLFLALTFVLSMSVFVFADDKGSGVADNGAFTISGDARVRGIAKTNYDLDDSNAPTTDADDRYYDQRLRLKLTGMVGNGIEVRTRLNMGDDQWADDGIQGDTVNVDYFYLHVPVGPVVIDAGTKTRNWGHKLLIWDDEYEGIEITTDVGAIKLGLYTDKVVDSRATGTGSENLEDHDNYGFTAVYSTDTLTAGLHIIKEEDKNQATDLDGTQVDVYLSTTVGAVSIAAEIAQKSGDLNEVAGDKPLGALIAASTDVGAINVSVFAAIFKDGFVANNDLHPSVMLGTAHPTAIADIQADQDSTTKAFAISASTDVSSDLTVGAGFLWADLENLGTELGGSDTGKEEISEIDLTLAYKLADNATYYIDFGYLMPDNITTQDDEAIALAHKIQVYF